MERIMQPNPIPFDRNADRNTRRTASAPGPVTGALRAMEAILLRGGGQRTARRNAWAAVCEDRRRARDRHEAQSVLGVLGAENLGTR
jgi:hypothetical protein